MVEDMEERRGAVVESWDAVCWVRGGESVEDWCWLWRVIDVFVDMRAVVLGVGSPRGEARERTILLRGSMLVDRREAGRSSVSGL